MSLRRSVLIISQRILFGIKGSLSCLGISWKQPKTVTNDTGTENATEEREVSDPGSKANDRKNRDAKQKYLPTRHAGIPELHDVAASCNAK